MISFDNLLWILSNKILKFDYTATNLECERLVLIILYKHSITVSQKSNVIFTRFFFSQIHGMSSINFSIWVSTINNSWLIFIPYCVISRRKQKFHISFTKTINSFKLHRCSNLKIEVTVHKLISSCVEYSFSSVISPNLNEERLIKLSNFILEVKWSYLIGILCKGEWYIIRHCESFIQSIIDSNIKLVGIIKIEPEN